MGFGAREEVRDRGLPIGRLRGHGGLLRDGGASALRVAPLEGDAEARHHGAEHGGRGGVAEAAQRRRAGDRPRRGRLAKIKLNLSFN